jgi:hypothetical protein
MTADAIDEDRHRRIGAELLETWDAAQGGQFTARRTHGSWTQPQLAAVHSLAAHVHRLYVPAERLLNDGWALEAMPLIRTAYECALTAQWVAQTDDGANAFINENTRHRRALERTAKEGVPASVRGDGKIPGGDLEPLETTAGGPARNFEQLCGDLVPGGASAYFPYRVLSMYSHATEALVDDYVEPNEEGELGAMRLDPKPTGSAAWRGLLVCSLVWAGRAVDYFDQDHRRRSQLRAAARELGIESALQLSLAAGRRQRAARRARP